MRVIGAAQKKFCFRKYCSTKNLSKSFLDVVLNIFVGIFYPMNKKISPPWQFLLDLNGSAYASMTDWTLVKEEFHCYPLSY